jgi:hypothetical protein
MGPKRGTFGERVDTQGYTPLVLARQRLASEASKSEAGDVGHLRTVGRQEEDPHSVVRLTDARTWWWPPPTA